MTFANDVRKFTEIAERRMKAVAVNATNELARKIVNQTPIDKEFGPDGVTPAMHDPDSIGEARGGWVAGINGSAKVSPRLDAEGGSTNLNNYAVYQSYNPRIDTSLNLYNNVSYIRDLEFGRYNFANPLKTTGTSQAFSYQAPQGMMRINTRQWNSIVNSVKARVR